MNLQLFGGRGMSSKSGGAGSTTTRYNEEAAKDAEAKINALKSTKKSQLITYTDPSTGHELETYVEKVPVRDYWGHRVQGRPMTYTVYITDKTSKNQYGNPERVYYNYGMEWKSVKNAIKSRSHIGK